MTTIEAARHVREHGVSLLRRKKGVPFEWDLKPAFTGQRRKGWFYLDAFTASALVVVYDALNPENQERFNRASLPVLVSFCFKSVKIGS